MKITNKNILKIASTILLVYFIMRLGDFANIISFFPFDNINDISSYMAQLYFLDVCGFHQFCPYWYNGFTSFLITAPGWYFITYPLLKVSNVMVATFLSTVLAYVCGYSVIQYYGKRINLSREKLNIFFLLFFTNAIAIGNHIRRGRPHELWAWVFFMIVMFIVLEYKEKKIDKRFYVIIPAYALTILTYPPVGIIASIGIGSIFLTKRPIKEYAKVLGSIVGSIALTTFWTIPFVKEITRSSALREVGDNLYRSLYINFSSYNLYTQTILTLVPLTFLISLVYYKKYTKEKITFFYPLIIIAILVITRAIIFIPILSNMIEDIYIMSFLFLTLVITTKIIDKVPLKRIAYITILIISMLSVIVSATHTPFIPNQNTQAIQEVKHLLERNDGNFLFINGENVFSSAVYSYAPIMYNITTPNGWYPHIKDREYITKLQKEPETCEEFHKKTKEFKIESIIAPKGRCKFIKECGWKTTEEGEKFCLIEK